jgi:phytanoyl-CoA hydroxylase
MIGALCMDVDAAKNDFLRDGFVVLRELIAPEELTALREETAAQIDAGPIREPRSDFLTKPTASGEDRFFRIQFLTDKALRNRSWLEALAQPQIVPLVEALLGADWTSYGTAMVFKQPGGGPEISPHRDVMPSDAKWSADHLFFSADIYLDAALPGTGCLRVIPGSHADYRGTSSTVPPLDDPRYVDVPMQPGDVLFHNALLVHGSHATSAGSPLRRVLYYSYQSAGQMADEGVLPGLPVERDWIASHIKLVQHACEQRGVPYTVPAEWQADVDHAQLDLHPVAGNLPWEGAAA